MVVEETSEENDDKNWIWDETDTFIDEEGIEWFYITHKITGEKIPVRYSKEKLF